AFLTASYLAKDRLVSARKFEANKIKVISNCVIPETVKLSRSQICKELSFSENTFIITEVAFLSERKGQAYLIKALHLLFYRRKDLKENIKLLLVGDGEEAKNLKNLVIEKDLINNVYFLGYKKNSQDYIAASDIFILPSISNEDMPLVILTALQVGKPIIASNFAGIAQAIQSGVNGILIDYNLESHSNNLCDKIEELYSDPVLRNNLSIAAKKSFLE